MSFVRLLSPSMKASERGQRFSIRSVIRATTKRTSCTFQTSPAAVRSSRRVRVRSSARMSRTFSASKAGDRATEDPWKSAQVTIDPSPPHHRRKQRSRSFPRSSSCVQCMHQKTLWCMHIGRSNGSAMSELVRHSVNCSRPILAIPTTWKFGEIACLSTCRYWYCKSDAFCLLLV